MRLLLYLLIIATISVFVLLIYSLIFARRQNVLSRLNDVKKSFNDSFDDEIMVKPFSERVLKPAYEKFVGLIGRSTPRGISNNLQQTIAYAGSPSNLTVNRLMAIMLMSAMLLAILTYLALRNNYNPFLVVLMGILGFILPIYIIRGMARNRQSKIQNTLPDILDLIYVSVEAGLGFDMALKRTTEKMQGPLSDEFDKALDEINKGKSREDALRSIVYRTGVDDLSSFITSVIQSEQLGSNIANMLRIQSSTMRQKRRQRAEERAMKVPVKMLFPLVFFMLPALFIVILGPALLRIIAVLGDMF